MSGVKIGVTISRGTQTMKKLLLIGLILAAFAAVSPLLAQDPAPQTPSPEEVEKQKAELEKNGYRLLDQVINEAQSLRLPENRVRTQIGSVNLSSHAVFG